MGLDLDLAFENQAYTLNAGDLSLRPRVGTEVSYKGIVALRAGISDVIVSDRFGTQITPTVGAGLNMGALSLDYGFGDFGGLQSDLGYSHRVSLRYTLERERYVREPQPAPLPADGLQ
jgi:hypothetical protein